MQQYSIKNQQMFKKNSNSEDNEKKVSGNIQTLGDSENYKRRKSACFSVESGVLLDVP